MYCHGKFIARPVEFNGVGDMLHLPHMLLNTWILNEDEWMFTKAVCIRLQMFVIVKSLENMFHFLRKTKKRYAL